MPEPATVDLSALRGDTFSQTFSIESGGEPIDLTGSTVAAALWNPRTGETVPLVVALDPEPGSFTLTFPDPPPEAGRYRYDVEQTDVDGNVRTWIAGGFNVKRDVTNAV